VKIRRWVHDVAAENPAVLTTAGTESQAAFVPDLHLFHPAAIIAAIRANAENPAGGWTAGIRSSESAQMGLFDGKKGLVLGIANDRSIAWAITEQLHEQGAAMGFTHLPDFGDRPKNQRKVSKLVDPIGARFLIPCDVCVDQQIEAVMDNAAEEFGTIDFILHSIAFAPPADLTGPTWACSRDGFKTAMEISAYSLLAVAGAAKKKEILSNNSAILTLSYFGGEEVIPGYNLMGLCKAALECGVRYLASELGPGGTRVNAISAGPVRTVSAMGVGDLKQMLELYGNVAPLRRNITAEEVGKSGMFLLSDLASGISAEVLHVDCGFSKMGAPPKDFGQSVETS